MTNTQLMTKYVLFALLLMLWQPISGFGKSLSTQDPLEFDLFFEDPIVFSASRIEEPISEAPAAISVITGEQLEQWGVVDLPEAFRLIPGMDVTAFNGREWSVTARGFNEKLARRMLVLVDGMSVYTHLFSGIPWASLPILVDDIEKIEVIRGPNDTLYGFNAFNGVINITTKNPKKTKGFLGKYVYGNHNRDEFIARYSDHVDLDELGKFDFRLGYTFLQNDGFGDDGGQEFEDARRINQVNARIDYHFNDKTHLEYLFGVNYGPHSQGPTAVTGPFATAFERTNRFQFHQFRLNHEFSENHQAYLQFYRWSFNQDAKSLSGGLATRDHYEAQYDVEFQDSFSLWEGKSQTVLGATYRHNVTKSLLVRHQFPPRQRQSTRDNLFSFFVNEKLILIKDQDWAKQVSIVGGVRLEGSTFIPNLEWAPRVSLLYAPTKDHHFRATYALAYRLPSFLEEHFSSFTPAATGTATRLLGNPDLDREQVHSYELGYSGKYLKGRLDFDADVFIADYDNLVHLVSAPGAVPTSSFSNALEARSYGVELSMMMDWTPWLKSFANYTYEHISDTQTSPISQNFHDATPRHKANFGINAQFKKDTIESMPFLEGLSLNMNLHYRDRHVSYSENGFALSRFDVKKNIRLDLRAAKSFLDDDLELAFTIHNLTGADHFEARFVEVPRIYLFSVTMRNWPWETWKRTNGTKK